ncbi:hypothetical protein J8I29_21280 [Labrys sp. LIt4]|uniref:hypothetical protein n=1 Tax=Labrys sp. LIt4 TaxID=2821355 RepID=UPI001ADF77E5|nr:hypothetical protein [Labrys sp. LIt4]MBP0581876.1 hypothetical protein [Labrys sp. LIt4]
MIAAALALFRLIPPHLLLRALAIVAALTALWLFIQDRERAATQRAAANIERANHVAKERFVEAREAVDRCYSAGGDWDRFERVCKRGAR